MTIRFATPEDASALLEIYRPYVEHTSISFETQVPSLAEFQNRIREYSDFYPYLVVQDQEKILGYAYAHPFHPRQAYQWTVETSVYTDQAHRGQGIGTLLYTALFRLLKAQGIQNVCAVVTIPNDPSLRFHQAMGFQIGNLLPDFGYKLGAWHGVAYLYRHLGTHDSVPSQPRPIGDLPEAVVKNLTKI